jgi:hypothetical protein
MVEIKHSVLLEAMIIMAIIFIIAVISGPNLIAFKNRYFLKMPPNNAVVVNPSSSK